MSKLSVITLSGGTEDRGLMYGSVLRERIRETWRFYREKVFLNSPLRTEEIRKRALSLAELVTAFNPAYTLEMDAIAEGAGLEAWQIYALNARTEILNAPVGECTSLYFQESMILGQTWDWLRALEELMIVLKYEDVEGRNIVTLTEPGMLAKVGMNDCGLGVCLNILISEHPLDGVPVHIVLRAILECGSLEEAKEVITRSGYGKSSHILVGDASGRCHSVEFSGGQSAVVESTDGNLVHTNHCLNPEVSSKLIPSTVERLAQARAGLAGCEHFDLDTMLRILLDDEQGPLAVQACYRPEEVLGGLEVGTCATIVMDLKKHEFLVSKGPSSSPEFLSIEV